MGKCLGMLKFQIFFKMPDIPDSKDKREYPLGCVTVR